MICSYCQQVRNNPTGPCPHCGSPAIEQMPGWDQTGMGNWGAQQMGQVSFDAAPPTYGTNTWGIQEPAQTPWNNQAQSWPHGAPQVEQPAWGMQPQDAQQQYWSAAPPAEQSPWGIQPSNSQQPWNAPAQEQGQAWGSPTQDQQQSWAPPAQEQQWGWSIPPEEQQNWQMPSANQAINTPQQPVPFSPTTPETHPEQGNQQMGLVPYQGGMELQNASSRTSMLQILPNDLAERMLPAIPQEEMAVYVPPMYTKPRAIIPRYRAISGLLSVIIVAIFLCSGAVYAARATGTFATLTKIVTGDSHPAPLPRQVITDLPEPKVLIETGPAYGTIYSATTTSLVDNVGLPVLPEHIFKVNKVIHLTYAVKSSKPGTVQIQWFSNGHPLADPITPPFDPKDGQNKHADATIVYALPAEGWVELKWNNQLAMRLYFVVRQ